MAAYAGKSTEEMLCDVIRVMDTELSATKDALFKAVAQLPPPNFIV